MSRLVCLAWISTTVIACGFVNALSPKTTETQDSNDRYLFPIRIDDRFTLIDRKGAIVQSDLDVVSSSPSPTPLAIRDGLLYSFNNEGEFELISMNDFSRTSTIEDLGDGVFEIRFDDNTNKIVDVSSQLTLAEDCRFPSGGFENDSIIFWSVEDKKYGVLDRRGNVLIPAEYFYIQYVAENWVVATKESGESRALGVLDLANNWIVEPSNLNLAFGRPSRFGIWVYRDEGLGVQAILLSPRGRRVTALDPAVRLQGGFQQGWAPFYWHGTNERAGLCSASGELVFIDDATTIGPVSDGVRVFSSTDSGQIGIMSSDGAILEVFESFNSKLDLIGDFVNGLAYVVSSDSIGYIDKNGEWVFRQSTVE